MAGDCERADQGEHQDGHDDHRAASAGAAHRIGADQPASCFFRWSANRSASATTVSVGLEHP
jgi:hypothetical protein